MTELINKIKNSIYLSPEAEALVLKLAKKKNIKKGTQLIKKGQIVNTTYYVMDGCLRSYCLDKHEKEHTLQFAVKNWWISDFTGLFHKKEAALTVECLTDSTVIEFTTDKLNEIYAKYPEFNKYQRNNLEQHVIGLHKRLLNQLQLSALERYQIFVQQYPDIHQYVPNYHIASYLGITQQSLSRLRAKK